MPNTKKITNNTNGNRKGRSKSKGNAYYQEKKLAQSQQKHVSLKIEEFGTPEYPLLNVYFPKKYGEKEVPSSSRSIDG